MCRISFQLDHCRHNTTQNSRSEPAGGSQGRRCFSIASCRRRQGPRSLALEDPWARTPIYIYYRPAPFVHSELLAIDDAFLQIEPYNIERRNLWLNFELAVNSSGRGLRERIDHYPDAKQPRSSRLIYEELGARNILARIRNAMFRFLKHYL